MSRSKLVGMADVTAAAAPPSRRERLRARTLADLRAAARRLLVEDGLHAVTLSAVAAEVGMSAPALYRYVENRDGLLELVAASVAGDLATTLVEARRSAGDDPLAQTLTLCRTFRTWALAHRREFTLLFADTSHGIRPGTARRFGVPSDADLAPELRGALEPYRSRLTASARAAGIDIGQIPLGATYALLHYWTRVYGLISMEISGHLDHAVVDGEPLFEAVLADLVAQVSAG
jgi:AcrR family transcriptional regulator